MSLVLEDGSGLSTSESYASVSEGDTYSGNRLRSTDWTGATTGNKEVALKTSTRCIDAVCEFIGVKKLTTAATQALGWPRDYAVQSNNGCYPVYWPNDAIPKGLKNATCELAIELLKADRTSDTGSKGIKSLDLGQGALTIDFDASNAREMIPDVVWLLLRPFGTLITGKGVRFVKIVRA